MVISTYQVQDRGTNQAPILGTWAANGVGSGIAEATYNQNLTSTASSTGEYGTFTKSLAYGLTQGWGKTLNNSK